MIKSQSNLIEGKILPSLIKFTIPILLALALQVMYSSVDLLIVGNFGTVEDVSGVGTGSQLIVTLTSLCSGLATGTTILLGQLMGRGEKKEYTSVISNSVYIFLVFSVIVSIMILLFLPNLVTILNTPNEAISHTNDYIFYSAIGVPMIFLYNLLGSIFRGFGDSRTPLMAVGIACIVNILGDLILVGTLGMGASGAAIATVIAQTTSVLIIIVMVIKKKNISAKLEKKLLKPNAVHLKRVLKLGIPIAIHSSINSMSFLLIAVIVNQFGVEYSAAVSLSEKLTGLIMLVPLSFMQSLSVFIAQNYGANRYDRMRKGLTISYCISLAFGMLMASATFFQGNVLVGIFSDSGDVITLAHQYLKAYALDVLLVPMYFCFTGYFNGCGKTVFVMIQSLAGGILLRVPLFYLLSTIEPTSLFTMGLAIGSTTAIQNIVCILFFLYLTKQRKGSLS